MLLAQTSKSISFGCFVRVWNPNVGSVIDLPQGWILFVLFLSLMFYFAINKSIIDRKRFGNALEKGKVLDVGKYFSSNSIVGVELELQVS